MPVQLSHKRILAALRAGLLVFGLLICFQRAAQASVSYTVNSQLDQVDDNPGNGQCHTLSNRCTLRAAIMEANRAVGGPVTILVPSGTYTLTIPPAGSDDETTGDLNITPGTPQVTLQGSGAASTILNANVLDRVLMLYGRSVVLKDLTVRGGYASTIGGGGIWVTTNGSLLVQNSAIIWNWSNAEGGGIAAAGSDLVLVNSLVAYNTAISFGGGIDTYQQSLKLVGSTVAGNLAGNNGGGIRIRSFGAPGATVQLINCTLSDNRSTENGGGLSVDTTEAGNTTSLYNVTIAGNTADFDVDGQGTGGGLYVYNGGYFDLRNSLLADNVASSCAGQYCFAAPQDCSGIATSYGYNLIQVHSFDCVIVGVATGNQFDVDPQLGLLRYNGGPTPTHALLRGSPAVDAGNVGDCRDDQGATLQNDQRGWRRIIGTYCDIGAFEAPEQVFLPLLRR